MKDLDPTRAALLALDFQNYGVHPQGYWATHDDPDWPAIARPAVDNTALVFAAAWLAETEPHADDLARFEPPGAFQQRQADRRMLLAAIHAGLLRRVLLLARTR
jgi:nicotinamidase-related amidase